MMVHSPCWHYHLSAIRNSCISSYLNATQIGQMNCVWMQERNCQLLTYKEVVWIWEIVCVVMMTIHKFPFTTLSEQNMEYAILHGVKLWMHSLH
jgi:hypothetical protein